MRGLWQRLILSLTPGVRVALSVWTAFFILSVALNYFSIADVGGWVGLTGPAFRHGQFWRLISYALLPANLMDLIMNGFAVIWFGGMLERIWSPRDFFLYCLIAAAGSGLAQNILRPNSIIPLLGPGPIVFALLLATGRLFANAPVLIPPSLQLTMRQTVFLLSAITILMLVFTAGWANAIIRLAGGGCGILYLWLRSEIVRPREPQPAVSQRISRLEL